MVSSTQTLAEIKSQEFIGLIKQHIMTRSLVAYITDGIQDSANTKLGAPQHDKML